MEKKLQHVKDLFRLHEINCNNSQNLLFMFFCKVSIYQGKVSRNFFNIFPIFIYLFDLRIICNQASTSS